MKTIVKKWNGGLSVLAIIPKSVKSGVPRQVQKTWRVKCIRPDVVIGELDVHIKAQIAKWAGRKRNQFESETGKAVTTV